MPCYHDSRGGQTRLDGQEGASRLKSDASSVLLDRQGMAAAPIRGDDSDLRLARRPTASFATAPAATEDSDMSRMFD